MFNCEPSINFFQYFKHIPYRYATTECLNNENILILVYGIINTILQLHGMFNNIPSARIRNNDILAKPSIQTEVRILKRPP